MTSTAEKIADADERGSYWLAAANEASDRGDQDQAEMLYAKGQYWLDRANRLIETSGRNSNV